MYDENEEDVLGGGFQSDDDTDIPLDDDLDFDPEMGAMKFDEEEEDPDSKFH